MIKKIKQLRVAIDRDIHVAITLLNVTGPGLQNVNNAFISLRLAKGWLGKVLYYIKEVTPYEKADTVAGIPPTAERWEGDVNRLDDQSSDDQILATLNQIRDNIETHLKELDELDMEFLTYPRSPAALNQSWKHLHEASMHLGFQLQTLRELHEQRNQPET